jgi:hypothetical protein
MAAVGPQPDAPQPAMRPPQRAVPPIPRPAPPRQPPAQQPQQKPWYTEPTVLGTIGVLIVVAILFIVLITQIMGP